MKVDSTVLVTGAAGFIGFFVSLKLLKEGWHVIGLDSFSDYYDVKLKVDRESQLLKFEKYVSIHEKIEDPGVLLSIFKNKKPDVVIHLAAQAGVRYSIENPRAYLETNIIGTFELLEAARAFPPAHMLLASTSSAYGASESMPYLEIQRADHQKSFYAATKKSTENIAHSYSHLFNLPITMFRFFTVYGPWGRPDMALFKFTKLILNGEPIDVYNHGNMKRDFTYVEDLVHAVRLLIDIEPPVVCDIINNIDSLSPVAPFRVVNIGNSNTVGLNSFIAEIEAALGKKALKNMMPMQSGDVHDTYANTELLKNLTNYCPNTDIKTGIAAFVSWYCNYYGVKLDKFD